MTGLLRARYELRAKLPATHAAVEEFIRDFRRGLQPVLGKDWFETELLLREALNNAVLHGARAKENSRIGCVLRMNKHLIVIAVSDAGEGFAWRTTASLEAEGSACGGRGMEIYKRYAGQVRFNTRGNCVTLVKRFSERT